MDSGTLESLTTIPAAVISVGKVMANEYLETTTINGFVVCKELEGISYRRLPIVPTNCSMQIESSERLTSYS